MGRLASAATWPVRALARLVGRHPVGAAGAVAVVAGSAVALLALGGTAGVTVRGLVAFAATRPAYPTVVVAGLAALLWRA